MEVESFEEFLNSENVERLLVGQPTYVVDCIDNIDAKAALVLYAKKHKIKIISACGAGMKADPTRIQIRDISEAQCISSSKAW